MFSTPAGLLLLPEALEPPYSPRGTGQPLNWNKSSSAGQKAVLLVNLSQSLCNFST